MADPKPDELEYYKPERLLKPDYHPPEEDWTEVKTDFRPGSWIYPGKPKHLEYLGLPNAREWNPTEDDWDLPKDWQKIIHEGLKDRLEKYRSFKIFMDVCVRCGACADKCHFYIGGGDPKNMPVLRAELLSPGQTIVSAGALGGSLTAHALVLVFLFALPALPLVIGGLVLPLMVGAREIAFPGLNRIQSTRPRVGTNLPVPGHLNN